MAGLPKLTDRFSNADEGMRKLWAIDCFVAARDNNKGSRSFHRLLIVDGDQPMRGDTLLYK